MTRACAGEPHRLPTPTFRAQKEPAHRPGSGMTRGEMAEAIMQGLMLPDAARAAAILIVQLMPEREVKRLGRLAEAVFVKAIDCIDRKDFDGLQTVLEQANIPSSFVDLVMTRVRSSRHHDR